MIRVLVVEDSEVVREALATIVRGNTDATVLEAGSVEEAKERIATHPPDVVFLDLLLPDNLKKEDILAGYRQLSAAAPKAVFVIVTAYRPELEEPPSGVQVIDKPLSKSDIQIALSQAAAEAGIRATGKEMRDSLGEGRKG